MAWRSEAHSFDIRRRSFCLLVAAADPAGAPVARIVVRVDPDDREVLLGSGHRYRTSRGGGDRVVVLLDDATDWREVEALITESYRILAPQKLIARLDGEVRVTQRPA